MIISKHAVERLRERFPRAEQWSDEVLRKRISDAYDKRVLTDIKVEGSLVYETSLRISAKDETPIRFAMREDVIVTIFV